MKAIREAACCVEQCRDELIGAVAALTSPIYVVLLLCLHVPFCFQRMLCFHYDDDDDAYVLTFLLSFIWLQKML